MDDYLKKDEELKLGLVESWITLAMISRQVLEMREWNKERHEMVLSCWRKVATGTFAAWTFYELDLNKFKREHPQPHESELEYLDGELAGIEFVKTNGLMGIEGVAGLPDVVQEQLGLLYFAAWEEYTEHYKKAWKHNEAVFTAQRSMQIYEWYEIEAAIHYAAYRLYRLLSDPKTNRATKPVDVALRARKAATERKDVVVLERTNVEVKLERSSRTTDEFSLKELLEYSGLEVIDFCVNSLGNLAVDNKGPMADRIRDFMRKLS